METKTRKKTFALYQDLVSGWVRVGSIRVPIKPVATGGAETEQVIEFLRTRCPNLDLSTCQAARVTTGMEFARFSLA